ncbi:MAG: alternative ribosome rescue aminoacyl-tRNA hydrolase ArfB [Planctomycetota bacterium]|jgi:ribosome-associated protein
MSKIPEWVVIERGDLDFSYSRSAGPGGQNVNKLNTRVTVFFDVTKSPKLTHKQKLLILERLKTRVNKQGVVRVVSQRYRTQKANRKAAVERLEQLINEAIKPISERKMTSVPYFIRKRRLQEKKQHSLLKKQRSMKDFLSE